MNPRIFRRPVWKIVRVALMYYKALMGIYTDELKRDVLLLPHQGTSFYTDDIRINLNFMK